MVPFERYLIHDQVGMEQIKFHSSKYTMQCELRKTYFVICLLLIKIESLNNRLTIFR